MIKRILSIVFFSSLYTTVCFADILEEYRAGTIDKGSSDAPKRYEGKSILDDYRAGKVKTYSDTNSDGYSGNLLDDYRSGKVDKSSGSTTAGAGAASEDSTASNAEATGTYKNKKYFKELVEEEKKKIEYEKREKKFIGDIDLSDMTKEATVDSEESEKLKLEELKAQKEKEAFFQKLNQQ